VAALLAQLEDGPAALVFTGEPGIGKTTVLLAAAGRARAARVRDRDARTGENISYVAILRGCCCWCSVPSSRTRR